METQNKEKKKGLDINENYDFNFAVKLNPVLRWILVLPMGLAGLCMVHLAGAWIVGMLVRNVGETSVVATIVDYLFGLVKYFILFISMVAMAPVARQSKFKMGLMLFPVPIVITWLIMRFLISTGAVEFNTTITMAMALSLGTVVIATALALLSIHKETNKPLPEPEPSVEAGQAQSPEL